MHTNQLSLERMLFKNANQIMQGSGTFHLLSSSNGFFWGLFTTKANSFPSEGVKY